MADDGWQRSDEAPGAFGAAGATEPGRGARRSSLSWLLVGLLLALLLGLIGSPLAERQARRMLPPAFREEAAPPPDARLANLAQRLAMLEAEARETPGQARPPVPAEGPGAVAPPPGTAAVAEARLDARIDALAAEVARVERVLGGTDARMRELFVLAVARRMLEEGRPLTPLQEALGATFGPEDGAALEALGAWSAAPQTRATLADRLDLLAADPAPEAKAGWWQRLAGALEGLVRVREPGTASPDGRDHLADARAHLAADDLDLALASIAAMPETGPRTAWAADARLLLAAEAGLDRLEAAALDHAIAAARVPGPPPEPSAGPRG